MAICGRRAAGKRTRIGTLDSSVIHALPSTSEMPSEAGGGAIIAISEKGKEPQHAGNQYP